LLVDLSYCHYLFGSCLYHCDSDSSGCWLDPSYCQNRRGWNAKANESENEWKQIEISTENENENENDDSDVEMQNENENQIDSLPMVGDECFGYQSSH
jgi:hypothetical protein